MENNIQIGDEVEIISLVSKFGTTLRGIIGHKGKVIGIDSDGILYALEPTCQGIHWPAECLKIINKQYQIYSIFN